MFVDTAREEVGLVDSFGEVVVEVVDLKSHSAFGWDFGSMMMPDLLDLLLDLMDME